MNEEKFYNINNGQMAELGHEGKSDFLRQLQLNGKMYNLTADVNWNTATSATITVNGDGTEMTLTNNNQDSATFKKAA